MPSTYPSTLRFLRPPRERPAKWPNVSSTRRTDYGITATSADWTGQTTKRQVKKFWPYFEARTGQSNPGWKRRIQLHVPAGSNYSATLQHLEYTFKEMYVDAVMSDGSRYLRSTSHPYDPTWGSSTASVTSAKNQAKTNVYRRIKEEYQQLSGPTFLGELRQTISLIRRPAQTLRKELSRYLNSLSAIKRQRRKGERAANALSSTWLEFSFGVQPLLQDIKDGAITFARLTDEIRHGKARGYGRDEAHRSAFTPASDSFTGADVRISEQFFGYKEVWYNCGLAASVAGGQSWASKGRKLAELSGFQLGEFIPTAWELLPWSFLIDYFTNIGDILSSTFTDTGAVTWVYETVKSTDRIVKFVDFRMNLNALKATTKVIHIYETGFQQFVARNVGMSRTAVALTPPTLEFSLPGNPIQWINMAALGFAHRRLLPWG